MFDLAAPIDRPIHAQHDCWSKGWRVDRDFHFSDKQSIPRVHSSQQWLTQMKGLSQPEKLVNTKLESPPDPNTVRDGSIESTNDVTHYGTYIIHASSDLYLFQIAADYHFHFVRHFLRKHGIKEFTGSWSQKPGPLSYTVADLF